MESVAPKWLGFGRVCLGFGIGGTGIGKLVAPILNVCLRTTLVGELVDVFGDYLLCTYEHIVHQQNLTPF